MENFFYNGEFVRDLEDLLLSLDVESIEELPEDWSIECEYSDEEPMFQLDAGMIFQAFGEERDDENGEAGERLCDMLDKNIDFERINLLIPKLHYCNGQVFTITKQDLL